MKAGKPSRTARHVALARSVLSDLGVVADPFAERMLDRWAGMAHTASRLTPVAARKRSTLLAALAARTLWFDAQVVDALDGGVRQVVIIGAGYDSRAARLHRDGVRWFEVDHPATQVDKQRRAPEVRVRYVPVDLASSSAAGALVEAGLDAATPAVFVLEGLTMYLDEGTVRRQLEALARVSGSGSRVAVNFAPPRGAGTASNRRLRSLLHLAANMSGEPPVLALDLPAAAALIHACGWTLTEQIGLQEAARRCIPDGTGMRIESIEPHAPLIAGSRV